jgi:hypothetical protein
MGHVIRLLPRRVGVSIADMPSTGLSAVPVDPASYRCDRLVEDVLAAGVDPIWPPRAAGDFAAVFPAATFVVQPGAGHYPWLDDARWFVSTVTEFLDGACPQP